MTDFDYVTTDAAQVGNTTMNLDPKRLWVNADSKGWRNANQAVKEWAKIEDSFFYKVESRKYLWDNFFCNSHKVRTPTFWEGVLAHVSNWEMLDVHQQTRTVIRASLMEVLEIYLSNECILLPLVQARGEKTPKWHVNRKPNRSGAPYEEILNRMQEVSHDRRSVGAFNTVFCSISLNDESDYTAEAHSVFRTSGFLDDENNTVRLYQRALQAANLLAVERGKSAPFQTAFRTRGRDQIVVRENRRNQSIPYAKNVTLPKYDPDQALVNYVSEATERLKIARADEWLSAIRHWVGASETSDISKLYANACDFLTWIASQGLNDIKPLDVKRHMVVRSRENTRVKQTYVEYLKASGKSQNQRKNALRESVNFFAIIFDQHSDDLGKVVHSPFKEADKKRFAERGSRGRGKSNKPVLPKSIIEYAKQVLIEDDYAFGRQFSHQYALNAVGQKVFVPTESNLLYTMLCLPIRKAQAAMLDSGEADEFIVCLDGSKIANDHTLATKGREFGFTRTFTDQHSDKSFVGFYINTNKEPVGEQQGYEIPYNHVELLKILQHQRRFQEQNNPINVMVDRSQIGPHDWRYKGSLDPSKLRKFTFLFRDIQKNGFRWDVLSPSAIDKFWLLLLEEIQDRLEKDGTPAELVYRDSRGGLKTPYTLHSLRVSNITHFIEAGVPVHVIAEFLSGHSQLVMTLYYTKLGSHKINEAIQEAAGQLERMDEDQYFEALTKETQSFIDEHLVGHIDGKHFLPEGDPGLWHIDVDGICVSGKTLCSVGAENTDLESGKVTHRAITPDGFNCAGCRFHVTGPAFLPGQVTLVNTLFYAINERREEHDKIYRQLLEVKAKQNNRKAKRLQDTLDKIELELEDRISSLGVRVGNVYTSLELMNKQDTEGSDSTALITRLEEDELRAQLKEARQFETIEWAAQAVEFFPHLPVPGARFRKGLLLEQMAQRNGLQPLLLHLSQDEAERAGNRLTTMMISMFGEAEVSDLMEGKASLTELGVLRDFNAMVGKAIPSSTAEKASLDTDELMLIGNANG
ncbi:VPA1269 family protein [Ruegeria atlantica]|uniref:VPA1269 family protein n=1 Tax=Ruegeria atlantica TaxID=81569 RepID=UPI0024940BA6|nr:VPA1269 family protein [Ruegeria atlantica]